MACWENLSQVGAEPHPANVGFPGLLDQVGDIIVDLSNHQKFSILQCSCFPGLDNLSNAFALSDAAAIDAAHDAHELPRVRSRRRTEPESPAGSDSDEELLQQEAAPTPAPIRGHDYPALAKVRP